MEQANSVKEFKKIIERYQAYSEVFYRGQAAKYKSTTASVVRDLGHLINEHQIYHETIQMKPKQFESLSFPIERLAKLQHYGVPTRLIDLTIDPLIALYFAVENIDHECAGHVYVYVQPGKDLNSKHIRLLSLLATINDYNISYIQKQFQHIYNDIISENDILNFAQETSFATFSDKLKEANPRLHSQQGTFAICGNEVESGKILRKIKSLEVIKPNLVIRILMNISMLLKEKWMSTILLIKLRFTQNFLPSQII